MSATTPEGARILVLRAQPIYDAMHSWLQDATLDEVITLWWKAQALRADKEDKRARRTADPDDMFGKSPQYVADWYAARRVE